MTMRSALLAALLCLSFIQPGHADEVRVVSSGGFAEAYKVLAPGFEQATGHRLVTEWGPSMGATVNAVPQRLARNEPIDVVIMVGYALGKLVEDGRARSRTDLANSLIGLAVRKGAPVPDISTVEALRAALLAAPSVAYSDSASGVYIEREMFAKMGIAEQMRGKSRMIPAEPVAGVVARGDAAIGFQQISELKPVEGITLVGPIPAAVQSVTVFSAGVLTSAPHPQAAEALVRYLASPAAAQTIRDSGLEPIPAAVPAKGS